MVIITFEVIANRAKEIGASQPSKYGRKLWNLFFGAYNGRICVLINDIVSKQAS